jgi:uncharacterized protein
MAKSRGTRGPAAASMAATLSSCPMAFITYILTPVICAFVFTGYGLRVCGRLERYQLYYILAAGWIFLLIVSPIWLRHVRFGPLEGCWRSLTYWKRPAFRRAGSTAVSVAPASVSA